MEAQIQLRERSCNEGESAFPPVRVAAYSESFHWNLVVENYIDFIFAFNIRPTCSPLSSIRFLRLSRFSVDAWLGLKMV